MDANVAQLFQPLKWCCTVKWWTSLKQLVLSKFHNKEFLTRVHVFMAKNNVDDEPLVINDSQGHFLKCQLLIVECYGHKAVEYGEKDCRILESQTTFTVKYSCILRTSLKNHIFLPYMIVFTSFEKIYLEHDSPHPILKWHSTTNLKLSAPRDISMAPPYNPGGLLYFWPHFDWK